MDKSEILEQYAVPIFDTLRLNNDSFITQYLKLNDEHARAKKDSSKSLAKLFGGVNILIDPEPESVKFSCHIQKINKHGMKQTRSLMIT